MSKHTDTLLNAALDSTDAMHKAMDDMGRAASGKNAKTKSHFRHNLKEAMANRAQAWKNYQEALEAECCPHVQS